MKQQTKQPKIRSQMKIYFPVCIHLDHATESEDIKEAINNGFTSVMYDGSVLPFAENAAKTKEVVELAHANGVSVEAELGHVCDAIAGTGEDALLNNSEAKEENPEDTLTDPEEVKKFIEITDVDALAVAIGTAHGITKINIYSDLLNGLNTGLKDKLNDIQNMSMRPAYVFEDANECMREVICKKIRTFGSNGRV